MKGYIRYIDECAISVERDVLFLMFHPEEQDNFEDYLNAGDNKYNYEDDKVRDEVLDKITGMGVKYWPCFCYPTITGGGLWRGEVCIDTPHDPENEMYMKLNEYFENTDGTMKIDSVRFCYYPISAAKYASQQFEELIMSSQDVQFVTDKK
jgi:hypothetical protein